MSEPSRPRINRNVPEPWQPRFSMQTMFLVTIVMCVMAASGYYLVQGDRASQLSFALFTLAAPILVVTIISVVRTVLIWWSRRS